MWKGAVEKNKAHLEAKVDAVLKRSESVLEEDNDEYKAEDIELEDLAARTERILE